jgi:hypothetical protein
MSVIPAKAGIQRVTASLKDWIPMKMGMTLTIIFHNRMSI